MTQLERTIRRKDIYLRLYVIILSVIIYGAIDLFYLLWELRQELTAYMDSPLQREWSELLK